MQVDVTPPTTATLATMQVNGWYPHPVTVTLTAVDVGAGVFHTQYRVNGGSSWQIYGGPFTISQAGIQTIAYQSTDCALNTEIPHTLTLPLDLAPPLLDSR